MASLLTAVIRGQAWWLHKRPENFEMASRGLVFATLAPYAQHAECRAPSFPCHGAVLRALAVGAGHQAPLTTCSTGCDEQPGGAANWTMHWVPREMLLQQCSPAPMSSAPRPGRRRRDASSIRVQQPCLDGSGTPSSCLPGLPIRLQLVCNPPLGVAASTSAVSPESPHSLPLSRVQLLVWGTADDNLK